MLLLSPVSREIQQCWERIKQKSKLEQHISVTLLQINFWCDNGLSNIKRAPGKILQMLQELTTHRFLCKISFQFVTRRESYHLDGSRDACISHSPQVLWKLHWTDLEMHFIKMLFLNNLCKSIPCKKYLFNCYFFYSLEYDWVFCCHFNCYLLARNESNLWF